MNKRLLTRKHVWVIAALAAVVAISASQLTVVRVWWLQQTAPDCPGQFTADELRVQVIKAYTKMQLAYNLEGRKQGPIYELALVPSTFDVEAIKRALRDRTLMSAVMSGRFIVPNAKAVDALDATSLGDNVTLASYSTLHRALRVTSLASIRAATAAEVQAELLRRDYKESFQLSAEEAAQGFGAAYFWIDAIPWVSLSCCDGLGDLNGLSPDWHIENYLKTLRTAVTRRFIVVNSCGEILERSEKHFENDDVLRHLF